MFVYVPGVKGWDQATSWRGEGAAAMEAEGEGPEVGVASEGADDVTGTPETGGDGAGAQAASSRAMAGTAL